MDEERTLDFDAVNRERLELIDVLMGQLDVPLAGERGRAVDAWLAAGSAAEQALAVPAAVEEAGGAPAWFARLMALSLAYRQNQIPCVQFHVRLKSLAESLGVPIAKESQLGRYFDYVILSEKIDANELMTTELAGLHAELAEAFTASATERGILELRTRWTDLNLFARLRLPAARVPAMLAAAPTVSSWVQDAIRLGDSAMGSALLGNPDKMREQAIAKAVAGLIDPVLPLAGEFHRHAAARSRHIAEQALAADAGPGRTALLVCGRFHLHEVLRAVRADRRVSWVLLGAQARPEATDDGQSMLNAWSWVSADAEYSLLEHLPEAAPAAPAPVAPPAPAAPPAPVAAAAPPAAQPAARPGVWGRVKGWLGRS